MSTWSYCVLLLASLMSHFVAEGFMLKRSELDNALDTLHYWDAYADNNGGRWDLNNGDYDDQNDNLNTFYRKGGRLNQLPAVYDKELFTKRGGATAGQGKRQPVPFFCNKQTAMCRNQGIGPKVTFSRKSGRPVCVCLCPVNSLGPQCKTA